MTMFSAGGKPDKEECGWSASTVASLRDDRLVPLTIVWVGIAIASANRAEGKSASAEPRNANTGALSVEASACPDVEIAEQAAITANSQASATDFA